MGGPPPRDRQQKEADEKREMAGRLAVHYECMANFIRTKTEPTVFYLPAKHTPGTRKLLEESRDAIGHKVRSLQSQARASAKDVRGDDRRDDRRDDRKDDRKDDRR